MKPGAKKFDILVKLNQLNRLVCYILLLKNWRVHFIVFSCFSDGSETIRAEYEEEDVIIGTSCPSLFPLFAHTMRPDGKAIDDWESIVSTHDFGITMQSI